MRVFVAGASGAVGRPLVPRLVGGGPRVHRHDALGGEGGRHPARRADAAVADAFDADALRVAADAARAEVVVHELTALPDRLDFRRQDLYEPTNRVRTEGTRNLLGAARAAGLGSFVCQSIAFAYRNEGALVKTEEDPLLDGAPGPFGGGVRSLREMEAMVLGADGVEGLVPRYGFFYGPGTQYGEDGAIVAHVRRRRLPPVGRGTRVFSFIHVDYAADATVAAVERGSPGVYNVTDDDPASMYEWVPVLAEAARAKRPFRVPLWLARLAGGRQAADFASELRGASNEKAKRELGWQPAHPSCALASGSSCPDRRALISRSNTRSAGRSWRRGSAGRRPPEASAT